MFLCSGGRKPKIKMLAGSVPPEGSEGRIFSKLLSLAWRGLFHFICLHSVCACGSRFPLLIRTPVYWIRAYPVLHIPSVKTPCKVTFWMHLGVRNSIHQFWKDKVQLITASIDDSSQNPLLIGISGWVLWETDFEMQVQNLFYQGWYIRDWAWLWLLLLWAHLPSEKLEIIF